MCIDQRGMRTEKIIKRNNYRKNKKRRAKKSYHRWTEEFMESIDEGGGGKPFFL